METRLADFDVHPHVRKERLDQGVAQFREDRNRHFDITGDWDRDVDVDGLPPDGSKGFLLNSMAFTEYITPVKTFEVLSTKLLRL